jgi:hypothetical protein
MPLNLEKFHFIVQSNNYEDKTIESAVRIFQLFSYSKESSAR